MLIKSLIISIIYYKIIELPYNPGTSIPVTITFVIKKRKKSEF